jgi:hypothetical protein
VSFIRVTYERYYEYMPTKQTVLLKLTIRGVIRAKRVTSSDMESILNMKLYSIVTCITRQRHDIHLA